MLLEKEQYYVGTHSLRF